MRKKRVSQKENDHKGSGAATRTKGKFLHKWEAIVTSYLKSKNDKIKNDLVRSLSVWDRIRNQVPPSKEFIEEFNHPSYRVIFGSFSPLAIEGNLASGGRFNIGGSQQTDLSLFPNLRIGACLYTASTIQCALKEAAQDLIRPIIFKITPKFPLKLWNLDKLLSSDAWKSLSDAIGEYPIGAAWKLQSSASRFLVAYLFSITKIGAINEPYMLQKNHFNDIYNDHVISNDTSRASTTPLGR